MIDNIGTPSAKRCFIFAPPTKSINIKVAPTHIVIDIFGSNIIRTHIRPPATKTGIKVLNLCIFPLFFAKYPAQNSTSPNFANSLGCIVKEPNPIQRVAP